MWRNVVDKVTQPRKASKSSRVSKFDSYPQRRCVKKRICISTPVSPRETRRTGPVYVGGLLQIRSLSGIEARRSALFDDSWLGQSYIDYFSTWLLFKNSYLRNNYIHMILIPKDSPTRPPLSIGQTETVREYYPKTKIMRFLNMVSHIL